MAGQPTYAFYAGTYGGKLDAERFAELVGAAGKEVDAYILPNEPDGSDEYKRAVCAALEVVDAYAGTIMGNGAGFTIGSFSMSAQAPAEGHSAYAADLGAAIDRELAGTDMLYWGIG